MMAGQKGYEMDKKKKKKIKRHIRAAYQCIEDGDTRGALYEMMKAEKVLSKCVKKRQREEKRITKAIEKYGIPDAIITI